MTVNQDNKHRDISRKINIIFAGKFAYPHGLATTKHIQNIIEVLKQDPEYNIKVLLLRQGRVICRESEKTGQYRGINYHTLGSDVKSGNLISRLLSFWEEGRKYIADNYDPDMKNILFLYSYPNLESQPILKAAKKTGYRIICDISEDIDVQSHAPDIAAWIQHLSAQYLFRRIHKTVNAVMAINEHLAAKAEKIVKGRSKVYRFPINIDTRMFHSEKTQFSRPVRIFYGGSFAEKDGVENLIAGFDVACRKHDNIELVLSGKGAPKRMDAVNRRIASAENKDNIKYIGYLDDDKYTEMTRSCDILCMIRNDSAFANTGFPYKLGEFLATGNPVIASNVSQVSQYLVDKKNALLIESDNPGQIAEAMDYLLADTQRALNIGSEGRKTAIKHFDRSILANMLKGIISRL